MSLNPDRVMLDFDRVHDLATLSDPEFKVVVDADLRRKSSTKPSELPDRLAAALRSPEHVERWYSMLLRIEKNTESQLAVREGDFEAECLQIRAASAPDAEIEAEIERQRIAYLKARGGTLRFKGGLDSTIVEANTLRTQARGAFESVVIEERDHYRARSERLGNAIVTHRHETERNEIPPNDIDLVLWAHVD